MSSFPPSGPGSRPVNQGGEGDSVWAKSPEGSNLNEEACRPSGITVLIGLHALIALGTITSLMLFLLFMGMASATVRIQPDPADNWVTLFLAEMVLVGIVSLASVVGMGMRAQWGWWVSVFLYVHLATLPMVVLAVAKWDDPQPPWQRRKLAEMFGCCPFFFPISALVIHYFFRIDILRFFKLASLKKTRALVWLLALGFVIAFFAILSSRFIPWTVLVGG